jgi:hypothetical protein
MREEWVRPDFQAIEVGRECTAYAGAASDDEPGRGGPAGDAAARVARPPVTGTAADG